MGLFHPIKSNGNNLAEIINKSLENSINEVIDIEYWDNGRYEPTPTIIEAAIALYNDHNVTEITKSEAEATNLTSTKQCH
jgi:hypothetical protein